MKITEKDFNCPGCMVEFRITVEPGKNPALVEKEYPKAIKWLRNNEEIGCPHCGADLEDI